MTVADRVTFVWGLKRSGIHLVVGWLYANLGGTAKEALVAPGLHPQLRDGFSDEAAGVAFHNNCGSWSSRQLGLGFLTRRDFERAAALHRRPIFGIEDCELRFAKRTSGIAGATHVLVLRDPLNNLASRLEAGRTRPEQFRVDEAYIDLFAAYCAEALGHTELLPGKTTISYNRFVEDRRHRDEVAVQLGLPNLDVVSEVSGYGGGSSFDVSGQPSPTSSLLTRYRQHPIPRPLLDMLLERDAVREACSALFGYDLQELAGEA